MTFAYRYPSDLPPDYMLITAHGFTKRGDRSGGSRDSAGPAIGAIQLPIPDLAPMNSSQKYGEVGGALNNAILDAMSPAYDASVNPNVDFDPESIASTLRSQVTNNGGAVAREVAAGLVFSNNEV